MESRNVEEWLKSKEILEKRTIINIWSSRETTSLLSTNFSLDYKFICLYIYLFIHLRCDYWRNSVELLLTKKQITYTFLKSVSVKLYQNFHGK